MFANWVEPAGDGRTALVIESRVKAVDRRASIRLRALWALMGRFERLIGGDAVREAEHAAGEADLIVSDMSWPGYESVPRAVVEGYGTILGEVAEQLAQRGERWPDLTVVPVGVGSLASAVIRAVRRVRADARIASAEPLSAACLLAALRAGRPTEVPGPHGSAMAGLNCGIVSPLAWPELRAGIDVAVALPDAAGRRCVEQLLAAGVDAGPCAGAAPAAATALLAGASSAAHRSRLGIDDGSSVLLLATDGSASTAELQLQ